MRKAKDIVEDLNKYYVYNPEEEAEEKKFGRNVHRSEFDSKDLRNQFMGTLNYPTNNLKDFVNSLRDAIDKMPDEWVAEFLKVQNGDVVEPITESLNDDYVLPKNEWYYNHEKVYYDVTYTAPVKETYSIQASQGEDGVEFSFDFDDQEFEALPYKIKNKLPWRTGFKSEKECIDTLIKWLKAVKKDQGIKLSSLKIGEPYYDIW